MSYDFLYKFVLVGDKNVGKTSYLDNLVGNSYVNIYRPTLGVDFYTKSITLHDNIVIKTHIWDTAGDDKFGQIIKGYYLGTAGIIVMFDITNRQSFINVDMWVNKIKNINKDVIPIFLIGSKLDNSERRTVSMKDANDYANSRNMRYMEISSKNDINVLNSFKTLVSKIYSHMDTIDLGPGIKRHFSQERKRDCISNKDCKYSCCTII